VGSIVARILAETRPVMARRRGPAGAWDAVAAERGLAEDTRFLSLNQGVVTVSVRSNVLLAELESFRRDELLRALLDREPSGRVRGLRFRWGAF
jgi:hypothetical protein